MVSNKLEKAVLQIQGEIMDQARQTYSPQVMDHYLSRRNMGALEAPDGLACHTGPCQDTMTIGIAVQDNRIRTCRYMTDGCITSLAAASAAAEMATGNDLYTARAITGDDILVHLGGMPEEGHHCATLAADTLAAAIDEYMARRPTG